MSQLYFDMMKWSSEECHDAQDPSDAGHQAPQECCCLGLESKEALLHAEDLDMEENRGLQTPDDRDDDDGDWVHHYPEHGILLEECLKSSYCCCLCLSQQEQHNLKCNLIKHLNPWRKKIFAKI